MNDTNNTIIYTPPQVEQTEAFARQVCRRLGQDYMSPEIVDGLSRFVQVAATIQAKHFTRTQSQLIDSVDQTT